MSILNRRRFLKSAAALAAVPALRTLPAAARAPYTCGCCLRGASALTLRRAGIIATSPQSVRIVTSSGEATTDQFLGRALLGLAKTFKVSPGFAFYEDGRSPNAFATPSSLLPNGTGTVLMGEHLFVAQMARDDAGMTVIAICAHEFGHIHQIQSGYQDDLLSLDKTVRPIELHADFLAGFFLALRKREHPELGLRAVGETFYGMGDTDFNAPQHHGTAQERIAAITAGFDLGHGSVDDVDQAAKAGLEFVRRAM
jgi:hypothetical protein